MKDKDSVTVTLEREEAKRRIAEAMKTRCTSFGEGDGSKPGFMDREYSRVAGEILDALNASPQSSDKEAHRVKLNFDFGGPPGVTLICPSSGCPVDEESGGPDCVLPSWVEAEQAELLRGEIELPVEVIQEGDQPLLRLAAIENRVGLGLSDNERLGLRQIARYIENGWRGANEAERKRATELLRNLAAISSASEEEGS